MKKHFLLIAIALLAINSIGQNHQVLFLGNSYTYANDLPGSIADLLVNTDDSIAYQSNTPGGYCLVQHLENTNSMGLIRKGGWDFVVLQEQSQMPSIDYYRYNSMYPSATRLCDSIKKYNPCAHVVFYMTWGRRDGGKQCEDYGQGLYCSEAFRDFGHMQDTMTRSYLEITEQLKQTTAPVGEAWRLIKQQTAIELFAADGSHPSIYGTYLTACVFYATFWNKSAEGLPHPDNISNDEALAMQRAADSIVLGNNTQWDFSENIRADFNVRTENQQRFFFENQTESQTPFTSHWNFGDGTTSDEENPIHDYTESGTYTVTLTVSACDDTDSISRNTDATIPNKVETNHSGRTSIRPNPCNDILHVEGLSEGEYTISDPNGRTIDSGKITDGQIECSTLQGGLFFLKIVTKDHTTTHKFVHYAQ